ncbi:MAG: histidinol-phosphate transaminase [Coriobacteriales bacterium]|jgi:histidinol-phosphate aminotransferase|nr:histidinol-phosphate transaminase [Coriobacteriales bacterium]
MQTVRPAAEYLKHLEPYDPKYLPARIYLNANENPFGMPDQARKELQRMIESEPLHRYPDPLAKHLRNTVAAKLGVAAECIVLGNGGDELLFNLCIAYGGPGRSLLTTPPTFSAYYTDALLTRTKIVEIPRASACSATGQLDFSIDEQAILERVSVGDIDLVILTTPNNPTGDCLTLDFIEAVLAATDAVVLIDHAYIEFADPGYDATSLLKKHANLAILRTFSKAYSLAGMRIGYLVAAPEITQELCKVRQPYSVDALAALAALAVLEQEDEVRLQVNCIISQRELLARRLGEPGLGLSVAPSEANYLLFRVPNAQAVWQQLHESYGILVRDLSALPGLADCLRVSIGTPQENDEFIAALSCVLNTRAEP